MKIIKKLNLYFNTIYIYYSYRIEHAIKINVLKNINLKNEPSIYEKIIYAVNIHREAMRLVLKLFYKFLICYKIFYGYEYINRRMLINKIIRKLE
jgi:hypothetical protein